MKARQREWLWGGIGLALSVAVFKLWPELDLVVTHYFYEISSQSFPANQSSFVQAVYVATPWLSRALFVVCCLGWLVLTIWPRPHDLAWRRRMLVWLIMAVVGLGLVVDWGLKDHVGRPRPEQLQIFGNNKPFVPAFELSTHCDVNCGFVSGHAAAGFSLMTWGIWSAWPRRKRWLVIGTVAGLFIGGIRIMQGGHFLSDVIFSGWAVWLTHILIRQAWLWLRRQGFKRSSALA